MANNYMNYSTNPFKTMDSILNVTMTNPVENDTVYCIKRNNSINTQFDLSDITEKELQKALKEEKKAHPDSNIEFSKEEEQELIKLFNSVINEDTWPDEWKNNYIAIKSERIFAYNNDIKARILTEILAERLYQWTRLNIDKKIQKAYIYKDVRLDHAKTISELLISKESGYLIFSDIKKAYYFVNRNNLYEIMTNHYGLEKFVKIIKKYYTNVETTVNLNNQKYIIQHLAGLRVGDPMSPFLFVILVDYILNFVKDEEGLKIFAYCDDVVFYHKDLKKIEYAFALYEECLDRLGLHVNKEKTKIVYLNTDKKSTCFKEAENIKYMGIYLQNPKFHINYRFEKAKNKVNIHNWSNERFYKTVLIPSFMYGIDNLNLKRTDILLIKKHNKSLAEQCNVQEVNIVKMYKLQKNLLI